MWALPSRMQPREAHTIWVQAYDPSGQLVHDLQAPGERFGVVTGVREVGGRVVLGSLTADCVAYFSL